MAEFKPKVRWVVPQRLDSMSFVGRDVLAVAHDIYIVFINMRTSTELVYVANSQQTGDGVDVIAGHKTTMFAFTEKVKNPRIFIIFYPTFTILAELKDTEVNRYKGLCLLEGDLVAGFSGFPNYLVTVWSWRSCQRLICVPTGVVRRQQIYMPSRSLPLVCECWGEGLIVWEVTPCYKYTFIMKRPKEEVTGWEVSSPPLIGVCFTIDGALYAVDPKANLYNLTSDGINMLANLDWEADIKGETTPRICAFGSGILLYGPDRYIRWLKKVENEWNIVWTQSLEGDKEEVKHVDMYDQITVNINTETPITEEMSKSAEEGENLNETFLRRRRTEAALDVAERLVSSAGGECAALWTRAGRILRLVAPATPDDNCPEMRLQAYKQRNITKIQLIAPNFKYVATMNDHGTICVYDMLSAKLVRVKYIDGGEVLFTASQVDPILAVYGEDKIGFNYGLSLLEWQENEEGGGDLVKVASVSLTQQSVSRVVFSPTGRELLAAAMSAGHIFLYKLSTDYKLTLLRYMELGRGLADCFLMQVGEFMRAFILVLFSDKFLIGERIVCVNAETGKDNKFAGKMQGPYGKLLPLTLKDTMLAIPHLSRHFHLLKLSGDKGGTVAVKMGPIINSGHELKQFSGARGLNSLLTYGADGHVILRMSHVPPRYEFKVTVSHRYELGLKEAVADGTNSVIMHLGRNKTAAVLYCNGMQPELRDEPQADPPDPSLFEQSLHTLTIINPNDKNYLDLQEDKKVHEESLDYKKQRDEVVKLFQTLKTQLVNLLEENIKEPPLHQLSLSEFNLHLENKKDRLKAAEKEREEIRLHAEVLIRAQEKVNLWIKNNCWDSMLTPRVKIYAIFSHYQVENFPVLPTQREIWPELEQTRELRAIESENNADVFRPWEEVEQRLERAPSVPSQLPMESQVSVESGGGEAEEAVTGQPFALAGTNAHRYMTIPPFQIPQTLSYSFLQMNWLTHITKLNVQNVRLWFNKQFDDLMATKRREVGLVEERNMRLRFIVEELNKLSDLRGSFHHLLIQIRDPQWRQEEMPLMLTKVEPEECTIPPYISPSQIVIVPPDPGPKDDFRERALNEMMDGVLEKLWHEEIKKPIPMPQCMLDKDPEHFNEEDLKMVFDYEAKVKFRCEEREKYRKMLHAEYAKLSQVLNEGIVKFNAKVKDMWLTRLRVDSVIGQETLNLMRLRRVSLDRVEEAEEIEKIRTQLARYEKEVEELQEELTIINEQSVECQTAYDALASKDRYMDRTFKNNFADLSPVIVDQCYKYFKKRPKWHQRASMIPAVLYELAGSIATGVRSPLLHIDCIEYYKGVELLDQISNMPAVLDEGLWISMCRLRRIKIDNEIRMRALALEMAYVESAMSTWTRAVSARRTFLSNGHQQMLQHREHVRNNAMNRTIQVVLPAGQVEIVTTGHFEDYEDASLILRSDVDAINNLILKVGDIKLRMMRRQIEFRKGILAKEWEHAQMKMKLRHMRQELYSYERLKIPKELQFYLKNKAKGYTDEMDYMRLEKEMAANKMSIDRVLQESAHRCEEIQVKISELETATVKVEQMITNLLLKVSEKRLNDDPLGPIRIRRVFKKRMEVLVARSQLIREVQANHTTIVLLQTELELLRLKTYPTLASFQTFC